MFIDDHSFLMWNCSGYKINITFLSAQLNSAPPRLPEAFHRKRYGLDSFTDQGKRVHGAPKEVSTSKKLSFKKIIENSYNKNLGIHILKKYFY